MNYKLTCSMTGGWLGICKCFFECSRCSVFNTCFNRTFADNFKTKGREGGAHPKYIVAKKEKRKKKKRGNILIRGRGGVAYDTYNLNFVFIFLFFT